MFQPWSVSRSDRSNTHLVGGDQTKVLALRLGTLANAARHAAPAYVSHTDRPRDALELVRRAQALVAVLELDCETDRIANAVAAPGRADAGLRTSAELVMAGDAP